MKTSDALLTVNEDYVVVVGTQDESIDINLYISSRKNKEDKATCKLSITDARRLRDNLDEAIDIIVSR